MKKTLENIMEVGLFVGAAATVAAAFVVGAPLILFKEEVIDRMTGEKRRKEIELQEHKRRYDETQGRIAARRKGYVKWGLNVTPILADTLFDSDKKIKEHVSRKLIHANAGGSFWDPGYREVRAMVRGDGRYNLETSVPDGLSAETEVDDNFGRGYTKQDVARTFAGKIVGGICYMDLGLPDRGQWMPDSYKDVVKQISNTARKRYIQSFKEETGVDLRKAVRERSKK